MRSTTRTRLSLALLALLFGVGCASKSPTPPAAEPPKQPTPVAQKTEPEPVKVTRTVPQVPPIYFGTDDATLPREALAPLAEYAKAVSENPEWGVVTIDGHCDERGSDAYNQALGERRAKAVERYLVSQGVSRARIAIRSFGSERPVAVGNDERAWKYNRRSELSVKTLSAASR